METINVASALARPFVWAYRAILGVFFVGAWMLLVNFVFIYDVWAPGTGLEYVTAILEADTALAPQPLATYLSDATYGALFKLSGIDGALAVATTPGATLTAADDALVRGLLLPHRETITALMQSARLVGVRAAILLQAMTIGLVVLVAAVVDGLVQRYARREGAGRESSGLYHRVKYMQQIGRAHV